MKIFTMILWKPVYFIFWCVFQMIRCIFATLLWIFKTIFFQSKKPDAPLEAQTSPQNMLFEKKEEMPQEEEQEKECIQEFFSKEEKRNLPSVKKVGNISPFEEDHNLRTFTVLNNEGEIFRINTATPGPFYGPVWTRILSCYENRETLCARLICPVYGKSTNQSGYRVKIGNTKAFMPNFHSLRYGIKEGINIRVAIIEVNPTTQRVLVSSRIAYDLLFAHNPAPKVGERCEALYWDYNDEKIYFL